MKNMRKVILPIFLTGIWINISEFFRNEILLKSYWIEHYRTLGLAFPSEPVNGMMWVIWGFIYSAVIYVLSEKFELSHAFLLSWIVGFLLMWIVTWNLLVLPISLLLFAIPLSLLEAYVGATICKRLKSEH